MKMYDIVTNDKYELPVKYCLAGAKEVAEFLEVKNTNTINKRLSRNSFPGKYKAVESVFAKRSVVE